MRNWEAVEAFVEVVQQGSFSAAAHKLKVSPSHISRLVSKLEAELSTPLMYRTTRKFRLSEAGERYFQHCRDLLQGFVAAEEELAGFQAEPSGTLRVTCATTFGERFLAPQLNDFMLQYPKVSLDLYLTNRQTDLISEGYDLPVRMGTAKDSNSGPALLDAVRKGLGIAQLPDYYVEPALEKGELVSMLEQYRYPYSGVWLVYPQARQRSPRLQLLCDFLIERFGSGLPW